MAQVFTKQDFDEKVLNSQSAVLVDFYADWCGPCKMMAGVVEKLSEEYAGKAVVGKVNIDEAEDIAARYGIMSIPTLMVFKGGEPVERFVGVQDQKTLTAALDRHI